jgi:hypothetical protein
LNALRKPGTDTLLRRTLAKWSHFHGASRHGSRDSKASLLTARGHTPTAGSHRLRRITLILTIDGHVHLCERQERVIAIGNGELVGASPEGRQTTNSTIESAV